MYSLSYKYIVRLLQVKLFKRLKSLPQKVAEVSENFKEQERNTRV